MLWRVSRWGLVAMALLAMCVQEACSVMDRRGLQRGMELWE